MTRHRNQTFQGTICLTLTVAVLAAGCGHHGPPASAGAPAEVATITVTPRSVALTTELPGRTAPFEVAEVRPQVNGILQERLFTEGADVTAGSLLYRIDPAPYQAAYDQALGALAVAEAAVPAARSRSSRLAELAAIHAAGQQDADDAAAALKQAEANVVAGRATVESAKVNLDYTRIQAPITGRIGRSSVTVGALVMGYQPVPLAVIHRLDPIYVDVTQASADLLRLRRTLAEGRLTGAEARGQEVGLILQDGSSYPHRGRLEFRDVAVEPSTGSVTLRMVFPNPDHVLLPGMFVRAVVTEGVDPEGLLVPQQGITRDPRGTPIAWIVNGSGVVERRTLTLGRAIGSDWLVTAGLAAGDRVIVEGRQKVRPGASVTAVPFSSTPASAGPSAPEGAGR